MTELVWSERALHRVAELGDFLARRDAGSAGTWIEALFDHVQRLSEFPRMGRVFRGASSDSVREMIFMQYKVYYLIDEQPPRVTILTVRHSREAPISGAAVLDETAP